MTLRDSDLVPPPLDRARLRAVVDEVSPWSDLLLLVEAGSTNAEAAALAATAESGLVVVADHQTAGRGRLDRVWVTPPRTAVTASFLLRPSVPSPRWPWLPLLAGVATAEALRSVAGLDARLKWPNDVLVDGRKIAGILVERVDSPAGPVAVIGIGINVSLTEDQLPIAGATSLALAGARSVDRTEILAGLLRELGREVSDWEQVSGDPERGLRDRYASLCSTLGQRVTAALPDGGAVVGMARDVDTAGMLVIETAGGVETVAAGDVTHLRPLD